MPRPALACALLVSLLLVPACGGDDGGTTNVTQTATASAGSTGTAGTTDAPTTGGTATGGGADGPYGACEDDAECPVAGSRCPGSSGGCLPPCTMDSDCPAIDGGVPMCLNDVCTLPCQQGACPAGMTCIAGVTCGYT